MTNKTLVGILFGILVTLTLVTGSQPVLPMPLINITMDDYAAALAKWNSLHVSQYEETISLRSGYKKWYGSDYEIRWEHEGRWKFVVDVDLTSETPSESVTQIDPLDDIAGRSMLFTDSLVRELTIENLFRGVDIDLETIAEIVQREPIRTWQMSLFYIRFDTNMGYPRYIWEPGVIGDHGPQIHEFIVENVKILKTY